MSGISPVGRGSIMSRRVLVGFILLNILVSLSVAVVIIR